MNEHQVMFLWTLYLETQNKDAVFEVARNDGLFPDGITRATVREVLSQEPPAGMVIPEPDVLFIDIETAPMEGAIWTMWKPQVTPEHIMSDWYILSYAWAWGKGEIESDCLAYHEPWQTGNFEDDSSMMQQLWHLMDQADIVIAHNGDRFDIPKINTRFLINGYPPPSPFQSVDTLQTFRRKFQTGSNRLGHLAKLLEVEQKLDGGGMERWIACRRGDDKAMADMVEYNEGDIVTLRDVYYRILPWIPSHPNFGVITQQAHVCPHCGSSNLELGDKPYRTPAGSYPVWRCKDCGAQARERRTEVKKDVRDGLLVPLAR